MKLHPADRACIIAALHAQRGLALEHMRRSRGERRAALQAEAQRCQRLAWLFEVEGRDAEVTREVPDAAA